MKSLCTGVLVALLSTAGLVAGADGTRLIDAVRRGDRQAARAWLRERASVNARDVDGTTALHWAVLADDVETARLLVGQGAPR